MRELRTNLGHPLKNKTWLADFEAEDAIGTSVHVIGWGNGAHFIVVDIRDKQAYLATWKYFERGQHKYVVHVDRCYFTGGSAKSARKRREKRLVSETEVKP